MSGLTTKCCNHDGVQEKLLALSTCCDQDQCQDEDELGACMHAQSRSEVRFR